MRTNLVRPLLGPLSGKDAEGLGLSTQLELDAIVRKAADKRAREDAKKGKVEDGATLLPASETGAAEEVVEDATTSEDEGA